MSDTVDDVEKKSGELKNKSSVGAKILMFLSGVALILLFVSMFIGPTTRWYVPIIVGCVLCAIWLFVVFITPLVPILINNQKVSNSKAPFIFSLLIDACICFLAATSSIYAVFRFISSHYVSTVPMSIVNFCTENQLIIQIVIVAGCVILAVLAYPLLFSVIKSLAAKYLAVLEREDKKTIRIFAIASSLWVFVPLLPVYLDNMLHVDLLFIIVLSILYIIFTLIVYFVSLIISKSAFVSFCLCVLGWIGLSLSYPICKNLMGSFFLAPEIYAFCLLLIMIGIGYGIHKLVLHLELPTDKFAKWILLLVVVLVAVNCVPVIISSIDDSVSNEKLSNAQKIIVDSSLPRPNIYWIHGESMVDTTVLEKYWGADKVEFSNLLEEKGFFVNHDAYLRGQPYTSIEVASLLNPDFYDANKEEYYVSHLSKAAPGIAEAISNNPLINGLKQNNYSSNFITAAGGMANIPLKADNLYTYSSLNAHKTTSDEMTNPIVNIIFTNLDNEYDFVSYDAYILYSIAKSAYLKEKLQYYYENSFPPLLKDSHTNSADDIIDQLIPSLEWRSIDGYDNYIIAFVNSLEHPANPSFSYFDSALAHYWYSIDENGETFAVSENIDDYYGQYLFSEKLVMAMVEIIQNYDPDGIIIIQGDHGFCGWSAAAENDKFVAAFGDDVDIGELQNHVISAIYIPEQYRTPDYPEILKNPRNIVRYLINNYVGQNYEYLPTENYA